MASSIPHWPSMTKMTLRDTVLGLERALFAPSALYARVMADEGVLAQAILDRVQEMFPQESEEAMTLSLPQSISILSSLDLLGDSEGCTSQEETASVTDLAPDTYLDGCEGQEDSSQDNTDRTVWSREATLLLLDEWRNKQTAFSSDISSHKKIWITIGQALQSKGHPYAGDECSRKFRNMKNSYKRIKDGLRKTGQGRKQWPYVQQMEELFCRDPAMATIGVVASMPFTAAREEQQAASTVSLQQDRTADPHPPPSTSNPSLTPPSTCNPSPLSPSTSNPSPTPPSTSNPSPTPPSTSNTPTPSRRRRHSLPPNEPEWVGKMMASWQSMHREKMEMEERKVKALEALAQHFNNA